MEVKKNAREKRGSDETTRKMGKGSMVDILKGTSSFFTLFCIGLSCILNKMQMFQDSSFSIVVFLKENADRKVIKIRKLSGLADDNRRSLTHFSFLICQKDFFGKKEAVSTSPIRCLR